MHFAVVAAYLYLIFLWNVYSDYNPSYLVFYINNFSL